MRRFRKALYGAAGALLAFPALVFAEGESLTIPDIDTTYMYDAAGKAIVAIAAVVAVSLAIKLFKKAGR